MHSKVDVIVPVYKTESYLKRCVDSILASTLKDITVILVDDGSPDQSGAICDEFAKLDNRVKVIHTKNGGPSTARNNGLGISLGEFVSFVDSDDFIEPDMLNRLYNAAVNNRADICMCGYNYVRIDNTCVNSRIDFPKERTVHHEEIMMDVYNSDSKRYCWFVWNKLYRRTIISDYKITFNGLLALGEDTLFNLDAFLYAKQVYFIDEALYNYVQLEGSLTNIKHDENRNCQFMQLWEEKRRIYEKHGVRGYEEALNAYTLGHTLPIIFSNEMAIKKSLLARKTKLHEIRNSPMIIAAYSRNAKLPIQSVRIRTLIFMHKYRLFYIQAMLMAVRRV